MKRICCFFSFLALWTMNMYAVSIHSEKEAQDYVGKNILSLDPVEGKWDVVMKGYGSNAMYTFAPVESKGYFMFVRDGSVFKNCYEAFFYDRRTNKGIANCYLVRIGDSNAYDFIAEWKTIRKKTTHRIYLREGTSFYVHINVPREITYDPQVPGSAIRLEINAIKIYPTNSMIAEARKRENERKQQQQKQEEENRPKSWSGSGFALNNGYVVTNYHVAEGANSILVYQIKDNGVRQGYSAKMVASDKTNDIAILKISDSDFKGFGQIPYKIKSGSCDVGESVWTLGYPMTDIMGDEIKFTDGKISARSGIGGETSVYQISVPIQHGNSGGPLFDTKGNVVGITSSGLNRDLRTENVNYAIKSAYLRLLIENDLPTSIIPQGSALQGQTLTTQIKLAKKFVFYIECNNTASRAQKSQSTSSAPPTSSKPTQQSTSTPDLSTYYNVDKAWQGLHSEGIPTQREAFNALLFYANHGTYKAYGYLGLCYEFGRYVGKDLSEAIKCFKKGVEGEDPLSLHELGVFYYDGEGVEKNIRKAEELFLLAAKHKYISSYSALGELYFAKKDTTKALEYLEQGVAAHSESAYYLMFNYYLIDKKRPEAAYGYLWAEIDDRKNRNIVDAYGEKGYRFDYYMGYFYEHGLPPVTKNLTKAKEWYQKAADKGDPDSKRKLTFFEGL